MITSIPEVDPHPVIVTIRNNEDYIKVLLCSHYTTITGVGGVLLNYPFQCRLLCTAITQPIPCIRHQAPKAQSPNSQGKP